MNCKQGDLAVIVKSFAGNEGKIVICMRKIQRPYWALLQGVRWEVSPTLRDNYGDPISSVADCAMRPIRDSDGTDEMLRLVGLPNQPETA